MFWPGGPGRELHTQSGALLVSHRLSSDLEEVTSLPSVCSFPELQVFHNPLFFLLRLGNISKALLRVFMYKYFFQPNSER